MPDDLAGQVTASVVSHRHGAMLQDLLLCLIRLRPPSLARLIVTLNVTEPSPDSTGAPFEVTILRNPRPLGFGANHNQAFRHCSTQWFAILNPDLHFDSDPLGPLLARALPSDALLAPRVLEPAGQPADAARRLLTPLAVVRRSLGNRSPAVAGTAEWIAGVFLLVRAEAFRTVGGFDERFFMYCEDADLSLRLRIEGWNLRQVEDVTVVHAAQRASRGSVLHARWHVTSLLRHWTSAAYWKYLRLRPQLPGVQ